MEDSVATLFSLIQQQKMFYKQRSEEIESRLAKCRSEYEASNERIERLELELVHSYAHKEEQKNTVESLKAHLALVSADSTAALEKERREREVTERHLKDQVSAASAKLADMEKEYAQKSEAHLTAMSSLESRLKDQHSSEISTLESHLSGKYSSDLKARESRLLVLQNEVDDYRNEYTSLKRLLDLAAKEKADHSIHIQNLVDDNKSLRVKMEKADEAASAIRKKLALAATGPPLPPPPDSAAILFQDRLQLRKEQLEDWFLVCRSAFEQATVLQRCMDEVKRKIELFYREALGNAADGGDDGLGDLDSGSEEEDEDEDDEVDVGGDDQVFIFTHQDGTEDEFDSNLREILNDTHERLLKFKSSSAITELSTKITRRLDKLELAYKERCTGKFKKIPFIPLLTNYILKSFI